VEKTLPSARKQLLQRDIGAPFIALPAKQARMLWFHFFTSFSTFLA
jgi:hypothetical protein